MAGDINLKDAPLSSLTYTARTLLSSLLNCKKVLPCEGPLRLQRDWRGVAALINISSELSGSITNSRDQIGKVLDIWIDMKDDTATIGRLLALLEQIDRYDIRDDLIELATKEQLINLSNVTTNDIDKHKVPAVQIQEDSSSELITFDDRPGALQVYHAYILYAKEDKSFIYKMIERMDAKGFKLCTEEDLLPGPATQYAPVTRLILERCHRIILVYSPDFLNSPANKFFTDYAQAVGIESNRPKIIPCMYRECVLPPHLTFYHKLYYSESPRRAAGYDFWERLAGALHAAVAPALTTRPNELLSHSAVNITELSQMESGEKSKRELLPLPSVAIMSSQSMSRLDTLGASPEEDAVSQFSEGQIKKSSLVKKILRPFKRKNQRKSVLLEN